MLCYRNSAHLSTPFGFWDGLGGSMHGNMACQRSSTLDNREASKTICSLVAKLLGGLARD